MEDGASLHFFKTQRGPFAGHATADPYVAGPEFVASPMVRATAARALQSGAFAISIRSSKAIRDLVIQNPARPSTLLMIAENSAMACFPDGGRVIGVTLRTCETETTPINGLLSSVRVMPRIGRDESPLRHAGRSCLGWQQLRLHGGNSGRRRYD
jgi:hypothetical protein